MSDRTNTAKLNEARAEVQRLEREVETDKLAFAGVNEVTIGLKLKDGTEKGFTFDVEHAASFFGSLLNKIKSQPQARSARSEAPAQERTGPTY